MICTVTNVILRIWKKNYERGETVCADCGLVQSAGDYDFCPPRAFSPEDISEKRQSGSASTLTIHDKGLSTEISSKDKDSYGKSIPTKNRHLLYRLRIWQRRTRTANARERNLVFALQELDRTTSHMQLPKDVRETAAYIYRKAVNKNLIRGRGIEDVVDAAIYGACRQHKIPRTLDEIATASRRKRRSVGRTYRVIARELKLGIRVAPPQDYIPRFCSELKLSSNVQTQTLEILVRAEEKELTSGRGPPGMAAGALFIATILCNERRTQKEVADTAGVTEVTVRNRYKELVAKFGYKLPIKFRYSIVV